MKILKIFKETKLIKNKTKSPTKLIILKLAQINQMITKTAKIRIKVNQNKTCLQITNHKL